MASFLRNGRIILASITIPTVATTWWYRPTQVSRTKDGPERLGWPHMSNINIHDEADDTPLFVSVARSILTPIVIIFWRVVMQYSPIGGEIDIKRDENYERFLAAVARRQPGQPLITVANHRSLFDDPGLMCNLLPWYIGVQPRFLRWNTCAQEVCFNDGLPSLTSAFFLAGKSLPVWRGGGVNQRPWLDFARHVANGEWCHVFPEAGIWQRPDGLLGGRDAGGHEDVFRSGLKKEEAGKLKWGVGKLIAHAPIPPIVTPFYHKGIEKMLVQNPTTRKLYKPWYQAASLDNGLVVVFGEPIDFSDLIEEHEKREGKLWKYSPSAKADSMAYALKTAQAKALSQGHNAPHIPSHIPLNSTGEVNFHAYWDSTPQEQILYHKIMLRIEQQLEKLSQQVPPSSHQ